MFTQSRRYGFLASALALLILQLSAGAILSANHGNDIDDVDISDAVADELTHDQAVEPHWIDTISEDGVITLSGRVASILSKERAAMVASTVVGVRGVVNLLSVKPLEKISDRRLEADVKDALLSDPATDLYEIEVNVSDGTIILAGEVGSWQEKKLAGIVAKSVKGARALQNDIAYKIDEKRSDEEIRVAAEQAIWWDSLVDAAKVKVTVRDGLVSLGGVVGSLAEKNRIIDYAFLAGASDVKSANLVVSWWQSRDDKERTRNAPPTDQEIRSAVRDVLFLDPRVSPFRIIIEVDQGITTLRGTVDNMKAKRAASRSTENTVGVVQVINRLKVRPPVVYFDTDLKDEVQKSLERDPFVEVNEIRIAVYSGLVELSGSVATGFERSRAAELAMRINGVVGVNNNIEIRRAPVPYPYNPYVDDWYAEDRTYADDHGRSKTSKTDLEIARDVEKELFWSPFVDSEDINVEVEDGVVTLRGTFESRSEFHAATKNAYDGGAVAVRNKLVYRD
jgi:osmotically-inducible protein OsmY